MEKNKYIYGIKSGDTFHYIGKTNNTLNTRGNINKSNISMLYLYDKFRNIFENEKDIEIVPIKTAGDTWYDEKLNEVVKKYSQNHPLINAQWMLEGKRGFWNGKKRDANTLKKLSESKYVRVAQYNAEGYLIKIWNSCKDAAINVFNDYHVVNGSSDSAIYNILDSNKIQTRFSHDSYWFKEKELIKYFNSIPKKIKIDALREAEKQRKSESKKNAKVPENIMKYSVIHYNPDMSIKKTYQSVDEASYMLKVDKSTIRKLCRGVKSNDNYILKYGEKSPQPYAPKYP